MATNKMHRKKKNDKMRIRSKIEGGRLPRADGTWSPMDTTSTVDKMRYFGTCPSNPLGVSKNKRG